MDENAGFIHPSSFIPFSNGVRPTMNHTASPAPPPLPSVLSEMQDLARIAQSLMDGYNRETQEAAAMSETLKQMKERVQKFFAEQEIAIHDRPSLPSGAIWKCHTLC